MVDLIGLSGKKQHGKNTVANIIQDLTTQKFNWKNSIPYIESKWEQKSFASKLKQMCALLLGVSITQLENEEFKNSTLWVHPNTGKNITPRYVMQQLGTEFGRTIHPDLWVNSLFTDFKKSKVGTDDGEEYELPKWIITDVRFPNEANAIKERGGINIRVFRPGHLRVWFQDPDAIDGDDHDNSGYYYVQNINEDGEWILTEMRKPLDNDFTVVTTHHHIRLNESDKHLSETSLDKYEFDEIIINDGTIEDLIEKVRQVLIKNKIL